jgi:glycosyltransferase involved in cell wall biosynthesis
MTPPRISVLLPVRNGAATVMSAIDSIRGQSCTDWELVAVDDGSTDGTGPMLASVAAVEPRLRVVAGAGAGLVAALQLGIRRCRSDLIARMDADDRAHPFRLERQAAVLDERSDLMVLGCAVQRRGPLDEDLGVLQYPVGAAAVAVTLPRGSPVPHPGAMFRRPAVLAAGSYRPGFPHAEDYDLCLRIWERYPGGIDNLPDVLLDYRIHPGSVSQRHAVEQGDGAEWAWWCHRLRQEGCPEPDLEVGDPWTSASRLPEPWRRTVWLSLILRRATTGANLPPAWIAALAPLDRREEVSLFVRQAGHCWRSRDLVGAMAATLRACRSSPAQVLGALRSRLQGRPGIAVAGRDASVAGNPSEASAP